MPPTPPLAIALAPSTAASPPGRPARRDRRRRRSLALSMVVVLAACSGSGSSSPWLTALTPSTHLAFPIASGVHAQDCNVCHGGFDTFAQFSCLGCHDHDQATLDPLHSHVAGYVYSSADCFRCHANPVQLSSPSGIVYDPSRSVTVSALVASFAGTSVATLAPQQETLPMGMDHATAQLPGGKLPACDVCHSGASAGAYFPGTLHSALANAQLPEPTTCADCHMVSMPAGFVGPLANLRTPPSGEMNHQAVVWTNGAPTTSRIVAADCGVCHASPSQTLAATWATSPAGAVPARFHAALASAQQPQPTSCLDCHANSRPDVLLHSTTAALPQAVSFDHGRAPALDDCVVCHQASAPDWASWAGGRFHLAGSATPASCLPCHADERPTSTATWGSTSYTASPFDYGTNAANVTHGDGLDCVACHAGPGSGSWGGTQDWQGGHFTHGSSTVSGTTCIACHMSQRPDLQPGTTAAAMATLLGFDHARDGTGDCFGCHQATVAAGTYVDYLSPATHQLPDGDWKGGQSYPGSTLAGAPSQFHSVAEITLNRGGPNGLVQSTSTTTASLYDQMLHVSTALPAVLSAGPSTNPDPTRCWHCHTNSNGVVTSYAEGRYHSSLTDFSTTPGGAVTPLPQPTSQCSDCHVNTLPVGIVQLSGSDLQPMDHHATFTAPVALAGAVVTGVSAMDCSSCHHSPTSTWADGSFHASIGTAVPQDCTVCHYVLLADAARADVTSGTLFKMVHRSAQLTFQECATCHPGALAASTATPLASTAWQTGQLHASLASQPTACVDCHAVSEPAANVATRSSWTYALPAGATSSNSAQWMNHGSSSVAGLDCVSCHATDAKSSGSAWSNSVSFHASAAAPSTCRECHGLQNGGGSVVGTNNNMPAGLTSSSTLTTASQDSTTGVPGGTYDQIDHSDVNVTGHDCSFCHTQAGISATPGIAGKEWAQARFHASFSAATPIVLDSTTGRCSNCHMNLKPGASFTGQDHGAFSSTAGTQDCSACHSWPGTGGASAPNWLGASGTPQYISVGGFSIPQPPATAATVQGGVSTLPHPSTVASGGGTIACSTCHVNGTGGKGAVGYDHVSTLASANCDACHEAGSNLVGSPWNGATSQGSGAGDTRPYTLPSVVAVRGTGGDRCTVTYPNHFYPVDCHECHATPTGTGPVTTGTAYSNAWQFPHTTTKMTNPGTCNMCHTATCPKG